VVLAGGKANLSVADVLQLLRELVGDAHVIEALQARQLFSQDVYRTGELPLAVVAPATAPQVAAVVAATLKANVAVFVRGGGMSYTDAYLPDRQRSIVLDMRRLNRVRDIAKEDLHATVEAGCTWAELDQALQPLGLRAQFWGPMSGKRATIGGAMSQGAVTFGSGVNGISGTNALGIEVALADGTLLQTNASARGAHAPFLRLYGPDLTGLFTSDAGALGVKTAVTLQLQPRPAVGDGLSFAFPDFGALRRAVSAVARAGLATEIFGLDGALARRVAGNQSAEQAVEAWLAAGRAQSGALNAIKQMTRIAWHGRRFLQGSPFLASFLLEGADNTELQGRRMRLRELVASEGMEIAETMAAVTRATPFPDPIVLGPEGMRLLPLHGIFPHSRAEAFHLAFTELLAGEFGQRQQLGIEVYTVFATSGPGTFLYEPVIYWRDSWPELHRHVMPVELLANFREHAANPAARKMVERLRVATVELMYRHEASHLQIGRAYPYMRDRPEPFASLLRAIKTQLDPKGLINPGALGL
jgi:D-lactate dehydrogenase (cytochrome)